MASRTRPAASRDNHGGGKHQEQRR